MTVRELIAALQEHDPDLEVWTFFAPEDDEPDPLAAADVRLGEAPMWRKAGGPYVVLIG